ncbi:MAG: hypothetical protein COT33_03370 [Candidatus Nealsonbacteria bacterium CG08_land_8_20_14_0_20_38_20]|uniref:Polysaccharide biosynthesis protein C-terminal domain-containing protein n=1 Tax=Candidatus Nealsonbacteria bacterium CG08_land_8_20_14_0_20_38_20 TaxID=1974705 RepID=A0A2H0YLP7_9BACT|nr:MAG: hypothetical protein COT33_03370 [Candidatus Nealsonbacteria bacterium CG08_land_8_20_14_0_20_38_20]
MNGDLLVRNIAQIKGDKFLSNSFIFFVGSLLANLGNYLFHFLMARMLTVEGYGELQSLLALSIIAGIPAAALLTVIVKYAASFEAKKQLNKVYSLLSLFTKRILLITIIFFVLFIFSSKYIADFLNLISVIPVLILGLSFLIIFLQSINSGILQGLQKFKDLSIISVISTLFKILLAVLLVKLGFALNGAIGAVVLAGIIGYFITFLPLKFLFKKEKEEIETKEIFRYSFPVFFTLLFMALLYNTDIILVKHFFSPALGGQYGALTVLGHIIFFIGGPMVSVMFPMASAAHSNNGNPAKILKKSGILVGLIGLGVLFFYFLFPGLVIKILIGSKFLSISNFLGWFGISMFFYSLISLFSQYFLATRQIGFVYLIGIGALLQAILISLFHNNLWQVVWIMNTVMLITLVLLIIYYFKTQKSYEPVNL